METYHGHVRIPADAIKLFEACRLGLLQRVRRRLSEKERRSIKPGSVFVWDEHEAGMRRWTDGKNWSASRVSGSFLTYREMEGRRDYQYSQHLPPRKKGIRTTPESSRASDEDMEEENPDGYRYKPDGLMKQSFSISTSTGQHLHLISYYSRSNPNAMKLPQPTSDPKLRHIVPTKEVYPESVIHEVAVNCPKIQPTHLSISQRAKTSSPQSLSNPVLHQYIPSPKISIPPSLILAPSNQQYPPITSNSPYISLPNATVYNQSLDSPYYTAFTFDKTQISRNYDQSPLSATGYPSLLSKQNSEIVPGSSSQTRFSHKLCSKSTISCASDPRVVGKPSIAVATKYNLSTQPLYRTPSPVPNHTGNSKTKSSMSHQRIPPLEAAPSSSFSIPSISTFKFLTDSSSHCDSIDASQLENKSLSNYWKISDPLITRLHQDRRNEFLPFKSINLDGEDQRAIRVLDREFSV
ncbi:putative camp-independent regulatory protein pac2 [Golovinomyces cichoracearum]|uniref:Putative camp-independent regulatory protein pac2 n=1 Tax=Golovinomyces cichoracearum TaxID=62708 RepID=A0A420J324_9PEZI|nr:putative camp-independent regulatory protein pac2 [Golovinomyces cichoracearum]